MQRRKPWKQVSSVTLLLMLALSVLLVYQPAAATKPECEDYCYNWYFQCRQQGGSLAYCTNQMMWCLEEYCGW